MRFLLHNYIKNKKAPLYIALCLFLSALLTFASRSFTNFSQWYAETVSPLFVNTIGRFFSFVPFSIFELLIVATILYTLICICRYVYLLLKKTGSPMKFIVSFFRNILCFSASLLLIFTLTASINYSRQPIFAGGDSTIREHSNEELLGLAILLVDDIKDLSVLVSKDKDGSLELKETDLVKDSGQAMKSLGSRYPSLDGYYPSPKPVLFSKAMSYLGITGIFSPFTLEANYNRDVPSYIIPYTICHELAHLKGFMKEDEAGFLAYLACINSQSPQLKYSGTLNALQYTLSQIYNNFDTETYDAIYLSMPESVRAEINLSKAYWQAHTVTLTSVARAANDKYLAVNAQDQGTKSYGMMVDLLLKEYEIEIADIISR